MHVTCKREITRSGNAAKPYARTTFLGVYPLEQLSDTIKRSIERGTQSIAHAARLGAMLGGLFGGAAAVLLVCVGFIIGRTTS
jgi:hypothetical protein